MMEEKSWNGNVKSQSWNVRGSISPKTYWKEKILLGILNFGSLSRARPGIFVAPYLLMRGWTEADIGYILFLNSVISLIVQTPIGLYADVTKYKRTMVAVSNISIAAMCVILIYYSYDWTLVVFAMSILGVGYTIAYPALYSMTLGIVGSEGIMEQVPINETCIHAGNAFFAISSGFVVYYSKGGVSLFWICVVMGILTSLALLLVDPHSISLEKARGIRLEDKSKIGTPPPAPIPFTDILWNRNVIIFYASIMFYHVSNASMLPLLAQILYVKGDHGFEFSCLCVAVAQLTMIISAGLGGYFVKQVGTKPLFVLSCAFLPIRAVLLMALLKQDSPNPFVLVSTQILDGAAGGLFGVMAVLVAENLSR
jgi:MFS family permease